MLSFRVFISKNFPLWRRFPGVSKGDGNLLEEAMRERIKRQAVIYGLWDYNWTGLVKRGPMMTQFNK